MAQTVGRRDVLKGAAVTAAGAAAFPAPAIAEGRMKWRLVTCWPKNFPGLGVGAQRIADRITTMSDGKLEVKLYAAGELVPAFEVFDAVREGTAEMGHDSPYYWSSKNKSIPFFASVPGGLTAQEQIAWIMHGGGQELWDELYGEFGLKAFPAGNAGQQFFGWYRDEIKSLQDLQGLKIRMAGLQAEVLNRLGATTVNLPGGEVMAALQSGVIDAAEWGGSWMDLAFGFYKVAKFCYGPNIHEPGTANSLVVNKAAYDALPASLQMIIQEAAVAEMTNMLSEFVVMNGRSLKSLVEDHGVTIGRLPDDIQKKWFTVSEEVVAETAAEGDINRRIYESWKSFRQQARALAPLSELGFMEGRRG
ncbi:MAG: ABC transporter substrate-binding protein [Rhodospirillaceae bacterium]|nr:ABC transporter substrate-binding protein [Rhodospirillaceae bacterium]|tara:strand:+ start:817 stop:1902 length:1086 start_codon:yes stop_codon:yes gene_type:complete